MTDEQKAHLRDWVTALRSGDYTQTQRALRDNTGYCCLGVACDLVEPDAWEPDSSHGRYSYHEEQSLIPSDLAFEQYGLKADHQENLANMNDVHRLTFDEIADYIEDAWLP